MADELLCPNCDRSHVLPPESCPFVIPVASRRALPDTSNRQTVRPSARDGWITYRPTSSTLTEDDAINLAAWLVAMVPGGRRRFDAMLADIVKA